MLQFGNLRTSIPGPLFIMSAMNLFLGRAMVVTSLACEHIPISNPTLNILEDRLEWFDFLDPEGAMPWGFAFYTEQVREAS